MIPADKLSTHNRVTRLLIGLLMKTPIRHRGDRRVVFYLDEFASLGYLEIVETAFAQYAGYGVTLWPFVQDISQLKRHYPKGWQSLVANSEISIFLPNSDHATNEFVSQKTGQTTVRASSSNYSKNGSGSSKGTSYSDVGRPLITPDEFGRLNDYLSNAAPGEIHAVIFKRGMVPFPMQCFPYYDVDWMRECADRNPFIPKDKDKALQPSPQTSSKWPTGWLSAVSGLASRSLASIGLIMIAAGIMIWYMGFFEEYMHHSARLQQASENWLRESERFSMDRAFNGMVISVVIATIAVGWIPWVGWLWRKIFG
jgi:type IV secretory pathway TraG/TraD family ATPase VirD4